MARTKKTAGKNVAAEAQAAAMVKGCLKHRQCMQIVAAVERAAETSEKAEPGTEEKETKTAAAVKNASAEVKPAAKKAVKETKAAAKTAAKETKAAWNGCERN